MSYTNLELTRDDLDAFESKTLSGFSSSTTLGLTDNDGLMASEAKAFVKLDLFDSASELVYNGTYADVAGLLDAMLAADDDGRIVRLIALKFLELFFGDNSYEPDGNAARKAAYYENKYELEVRKTSNLLLANMDTAKQPNRIRFSR